MKKSERDEYDKTYGLYKFKRPLPSEIESAMGLVGENILFKKLIAADYPINLYIIQKLHIYNHIHDKSK